MIGNRHSTQSYDWLRPGSLVRDTITGRAGLVMDHGLDRLESRADRLSRWCSGGPRTGFPTACAISGLALDEVEEVSG